MLNVPVLITHRFGLAQSPAAYDLITGRSNEPFLGVIIQYPDASLRAVDGFSQRIAASSFAPSSASLGIGFLGAGNFAQSTLLPALKAIPHTSFVGVSNATGPRSLRVAAKFGFAYCANSEREILQDSNVKAVVISTRHNLHASQVLAALAEGKAVFCEKPLCLSEDELAAIVRALSGLENPPLLMVGFNRRFAPMAVELKRFLSEIQEPLAIHYRVNAGYIPANHWVNDPEQGGGRILGEACHFVDFLCFLAGACPVEVQTQVVGNPGQYSMDNVIATLKFSSGTVGTITYLANGDKSASKERVEVFGGGATSILEDFRHLELIRQGRKQVTRARAHQDKGHEAEMQAFVQAARSRIAPPVPLEQIVGSTLATLRLQNSCQTGQPLRVDLGEFVAAALEEKPAHR